jgi:apolipoprotein N-acyltransferase
VVQGLARFGTAVNLRWGLALALAGGAQALALAWPWATSWGLPVGEPVPWLQCASLVVLVHGLREATSGYAAALRAWGFAMAWLAGTFWWLFISMHTYGGLAAPLAVLAVLALAAFLGVYYAVAGGVFWRWRSASASVQSAVFAALWTLAELARGTWFTGFPWGAGGYAQVDALGTLAPWVGVYGMGAVSAALAAWVAVAGWGTKGGGRRALVLPLVMVVVLLLAVPGVGRWLAEHAPTFTRSSGVLPVTLVQGNIPQDEKFESGSGVPLALQWYGDQFQRLLARDEAALVVAPETAIPLLPQDMEPEYWTTLLQAVAGGRSALMLGLPLGNGQDGFTNSVAAWTPEPSEMYRYDKHHLVPFGEFIPSFFRWFTQLMHIPLGDFNRGALVQPPLLWAGQRIAPNVCYEDLFGEELAAAFAHTAEAPTILVNLSNIAWFGDSVAIDQHRHISRLRALELQRPMLRATNTGATVVIDHLGRVTHALPRLARDVLHAEAQGRAGLTPYAVWAGRWGLWPLGVVCGGLVVLAWPRRRARA